MEARAVEEASLSDLFEKFVEATTMKNVLAIHQRILNQAKLSPCEFNLFFPKFKRAIMSTRQKKNWKAKALFSKIEKRAAHRCYSNTKPPNQTRDRTCDMNASQEIFAEDSLSSRSNNRTFINNCALQHYNCLVIGSGPAGLRTAIELQLLGASRVIVVEKRGRFSRNNVLHLWPFVIHDLKSLGAKKFYGKFCAGSIDHISIRQLQLMLLKVCLMIGCDFRDSCSYLELCPLSIAEQTRNPISTCETSDNQLCSQQDCDQDQENLEVSNAGSKEKSLNIVLDEFAQKELDLRGTKAHFLCDHKPHEKELHSIEWDIIIGADGRRNTLSKFFPRREFRGRLAIAITANFINRQTPAETSIPEISGISYIYNQDMFNALAYDTNIELENICYYKDDTHYFVMTAKKRSLLERGVLIKDYAATLDLLADSNVNKDALLKYAKDAAFWTTGLEPLDFALNHYGQEDCAMFDFTSMYAASNACKALRTKRGGFTLVGLVGDSLLEPFWPTGSGCARGFLSSFDAAWMCRQWTVNRCAVIDFHGTMQTKSTKNPSGMTKDESALVEPTTYDKMALSVIAERESIYRILAQTKSENLQQNYSHWTLNPHTRYPNLNRHLISPVQVEHLVATSQKGKIFDSNLLSPSTDHNRRVKSPSHSKSRRSPKKLKSAGASPLMPIKNAKNITRQAQRSCSRFDIDDYLEFEESYRNLADSEKGSMMQYINYKQRNSVDLDDLFIPSLSGTLPSSNNLSKLEARKTRDIDECLRQRRQKAKITIVRDQLISQMNGNGGKKSGAPLFSGGNAALFNEIRLMREQQSRGDIKSRDLANGPLSLLSSMRRCASFAERVKSFESKLGNQESTDSTISKPKTPIDNVKNLPQFATLQELIVNNAQNSTDQAKKSRIPVTKLSKDDWNVKCWEKKLTAHQLRNFSASSKSLNRGVSVDSGQDAIRLTKPKKQLHVFQDRINEMADKLRVNKENDRRNIEQTQPLRDIAKPQASVGPQGSIRTQSWVNHLKRELARGSDKKITNGQIMNPAVPNKPIKKLFEDEDDDDGIDINKHYDHLCINKPKNKYLTRGAYTSHLARTNINSITAKATNRLQSTSESKQAYLAAIASRGSSASSTLSDYSTNTANSSSGSGFKTSFSKASVVDVECFRCKKFAGTSERITIGSSSLHRICLACDDCGVTLRSDEIQYYQDQTSKFSGESKSRDVRFLCATCEPYIKDHLARETTQVSIGSNRYLEKDSFDDHTEVGKSNQHQRLQSREEFLDSRINYSELYKNIINESKGIDIQNDETPLSFSSKSETKYSFDQRSSKVSNSPVQMNIPLELITDTEQTSHADGDESTKFSVASSTTVDGSEQVTLTLPDSTDVASNTGASLHSTSASSSRRVSKESEMIDEEELQRILHLDNRQSNCESPNGSSSDNSADEGETISQGSESDVNSADGCCRVLDSRANTKSADDKPSSTVARDIVSAPTSHKSATDENSSSLNTSPDSDEDDDQQIDMQSTNEDFITSEEFDPVSDKEDTLSEISSGDGVSSTVVRSVRNRNDEFPTV